MLSVCICISESKIMEIIMVSFINTQSPIQQFQLRYSHICIKKKCMKWFDCIVFTCISYNIFSSFFFINVVVINDYHQLGECMCNEQVCLILFNFK